MYCRIELCDSKVKMNKATLEYAVVGYSPDLYFDDKGKPEGIWNEHLKVLPEYIDFIPLIKTDITSFSQHVKEVEQGNARVGSPQVASFQ